tara:strand:+ start:375 stop:506 length:132 start_codon:yes stop_codon:yes gene_type:complete
MLEMYMTWFVVSIIFVVYIVFAIIQFKENMREINGAREKETKN